LLHSDGVPETTNPSKIEFGAERFRQFLAADQSNSANQFANKLLEKISLWAARSKDEEADDDITMVTIHIVSG
jgi:phosphoserine phosphatase RsbU/P